MLPPLCIQGTKCALICYLPLSWIDRDGVAYLGYGQTDTLDACLLAMAGLCKCKLGALCLKQKSAKLATVSHKLAAGQHGAKKPGQCSKLNTLLMSPIVDASLLMFDSSQLVQSHQIEMRHTGFVNICTFPCHQGRWCKQHCCLWEGLHCAASVGGDGCGEVAAMY